MPSPDPQTGRVYADPEPGVAYVALDKQALLDLAAHGGSPPLVILGLEPRPNEIGYDLVLRRPHVLELTAALEEVRPRDAD